MGKFEEYKLKEIKKIVNTSYINWIEVLELDEKYKEPMKRQILQLAKLNNEYKGIWVEKFKTEIDIIGDLNIL